MIIGGFGIYVTWFWTPKLFGHYKYFLFNISLWALLFDIYATFFYSPWPLYPAIVCCPTGILKTKSTFWAKIWFELLIVFHGGTNIAVFSAFIYRLAILNGKLVTILQSKLLAALIFFHVLYEIPSLIFFNLSDQNTNVMEEFIVKVSGIVFYFSYPINVNYFSDTQIL